MKRIKIISVVGPTASGKTALSIEIAKKYNGEIISADSMQIYKGMDIATAKPTKEEMQGIVHHLIDNVNPEDEYSVAQYVKDARDAILDIDSRGKTPILVGGTGLYVNSLLDNVQFSESPIDEELRQKLNSLTTEELLPMLFDVDRESYDKLSVEKNHKRIVRALEIYHQTGKPKSVVDKEAKSVPSPYDAIKIGLNANDRQVLYDRINTRVDLMIDMGLLDEAKKFLSKNLSSTASKAIGYKEFIPYFNGKSSLEECKDLLKMETRRYAKRQITWFKRDKEIHWFTIDLMDKEELIKKVFEVIDKG
ncbi:MAG: tRNA (adenosine(37)-N6)-dimethylallyltransferase MiaA [Oscillospiraceae bacterium]|nr:tRNA (adenosine(37)-N6)-dimethylallyltransferase MiaA [Oscillospiraceae bacterium]